MTWTGKRWREGCWKVERGDGVKNRLKIIKPWPLKPETPREKRKKIRKLEHKIDSLLVWRYRCLLLIGLIIVAIEALCIVHSQWLLQTM